MESGVIFPSIFTEECVDDGMTDLLNNKVISKTASVVGDVEHEVIPVLEGLVQKECGYSYQVLQVSIEWVVP